MRANLFLIILLVVARHLHAADVQDSGWIRGPLVEVQADNSVKEVDEYGGRIPIGQPAFEKLTIRKGPEKNTWIVSGTVCSTNAGGVEQGVAIYAGYAGGHFRFVAMSNLKGEVLFSVSPMTDRDAKPILPTHLYVTGHPVPAPTPKGAVMRRYVLRPTE
jgi:hypothetical protein